MTTANFLEARLNRIMIEGLGEFILVVNSRKFGRKSLSLIAPIDPIDKIITDVHMPKK